MRWFALGIALLSLAACAAIAEEHAEAQKKGFTSRLILEQVVAGHLAELNGHYYIESGELTYRQAGRTTVYRPGDCFYETGALQHTGRNEGKTPVRLLSFEILPVAWEGSSAYAVPDSMGR